MNKGSSIGETTMPEVVYHYTDMTGLKGIVSSSSLWASDVEFLNDAQELIYARKRLLRALQSASDDATLEGSRLGGHAHGWTEMAISGDAREEVRNFAGDMEIKARIAELSHMISDETYLASSLHVYVTCFCEVGDLISQWRGYGGTGGVAVGFRSEVLAALSEKFQSGHFGKVQYGFDQVAELELLSRFTFEDYYLRHLTMVKHPAFKEEREWRLMIPVRSIHSDLLFRVGSIGIIPYMRLSIPPHAVTEVIVGPGRNATERTKGVRQLLDFHGFTSARVEDSESPLRF